MKYEDLLLKQPLESATYKEDSEFVITQIRKILDRQKETGDDKITPLYNFSIKKCHTGLSDV